MNHQPQELAGSLARMRFDYVDLIYSEVPPDGVGLEDAIEHDHGADPGRAARAWGTLNWTPEQMERAWEIADREGVPGPVATQPPYSLVHREIVEDPAMRRLAAAGNVAIVASYTLAGGVLTGKYDRIPARAARQERSSSRAGARGGGGPGSGGPGPGHRCRTRPASRWLSRCSTRR